MQMSSAHRMPLIGTRSITERSRGWRERFRKQCTDRIQSARQGQIDDRRRQKAIEIAVLEEWENFKRMHEQALEEEGILNLDVDYFLQEDKDDEEYELYNAVTCVNCQMHTLGKVERIILHCPACGFRATEEKIQSMKESQTRHASQCHGRIQYTPEPGSDALYGLCDTCDLWEIY